jgi:hypothetical protein
MEALANAIPEIDAEMLLCSGQTKLRWFYAYKNLYDGYTKVGQKLLQGKYFGLFLTR